MTNRENMPPLPAEIEPTEQWRRDARNTVRKAFRHYRETMGLSIDDVRSFTADQLRAYGKACWNAAIEAAAREMNRQSSGVTVGGTYANAMRASYSRAAYVIQSMKKEENDE